MPTRLITAFLVVAGTILGAVAARSLLPDIGSVHADAGKSASRNVAAGEVLTLNAGTAGARRGAPGTGTAITIPQSRERALDALALDARDDPEAALTAALMLGDEALRHRGLRLVAAAWARRDPRAALDRVSRLPQAVRLEFQAAITEEWAFIDPAGFLAHAEMAGSITPLLAGLGLLLATDPSRVWELARRSDKWNEPGVFRLYTDALTELVRRDPVTATTMIAVNAQGLRRRETLAQAARTYAEIDDGAALAWALALQPPSPEAIYGVIETVAAVDLVRAFDLANEAEASTGIALDHNRSASLATAAFRANQDMGRTAAALAQRGPPESAARLLGWVLDYWVRGDLEQAVDWLIMNPGSLDADHIADFALGVAAQQPERAAALTQRIPLDLRPSWMSGVALAYGEFDPEGALNWIEEYRDDPGYAAAQAQAVASAAWAKLPLAIQYVESAGSSINSGAVRALTRQWASQDPIAAAEWSAALEDAQAAEAAFDSVAERWLGDDPAAAESWVLRQPRGDVRDRWLDSLLEFGIASETFDAERLVGAFDSTLAADRGIYLGLERALTGPVSPSNPDWASQWLELISDPGLRETAASLLADRD